MEDGGDHGLRLFDDCASPAIVVRTFFVSLFVGAIAAKPNMLEACILRMEVKALNVRQNINARCVVCHHLLIQRIHIEHIDGTWSNGIVHIQVPDWQRLRGHAFESAPNIGGFTGT